MNNLGYRSYQFKCRFMREGQALQGEPLSYTTAQENVGEVPMAIGMASRGKGGEALACTAQVGIPR